MDFPAELLYTKDHEWAKKTSDDTVVVGITTFAVEQLGDVTIVELPAVGDEIEVEAVFGTVESVKAVSDLFAPVTGTITKVNEELDASPELVNDAPYEGGWMVEIKLADPTALEGLMSVEDYTKLVADAEQMVTKQTGSCASTEARVSVRPWPTRFRLDLGPGFPRANMTRSHLPLCVLAFALILPSCRSGDAGVAGLERSSVGWIQFGMSKAAFEAACRKAGNRTVDVDVSSDPPAIRALVEREVANGELSVCSGFGPKFALGEAMFVHARFRRDELQNVVIGLKTPLLELRSKLQSSFPDSLREGDASTHYLNRNAKGSEIAGLSAFPMRSAVSGISIYSGDGVGSFP